jgi:hypothetical protein
MSAVAEGELTDLACNTLHCQGVMRMHRCEDGGATFTCTVCKQHVFIDSSGQMMQAILPALYPQQMDAAMKRQYADYERGQRCFQARASLLCGVLDEAGYTERLAQTEEAVAEYLRTEGLAPPRARWWAFWRRGKAA